MRDAHRMKEKFDVTLDNRQIVSLLIAGIVVMGAVFVLGVTRGMELIARLPGVEAVIVDAEGRIYYSDGLAPQQ